MTKSHMSRLGKVVRSALLPSAILAATSAFGATLSPITPTVDHSKKATCGIKWTIKSNQAILYFEVYRGTTGDFWKSDIIAEVSNTTDQLTDWNADQYQNYYYWVIPYDYNGESNVLEMDLSRYACQNHRYWGSSDVYLTSTVKTLAIGTALPLYFKINLGTSSVPVYDHVIPDNVRITRMTDLNGKEATDIAYVCGNRDTNYAKNEGVIETNTYLKENGSFGYIMPNKPGVLYIRAYYKSATTISPLRIEIKKPTFNLYMPEGKIDIVDNNYRDLYFKCNGKFVCPNLEITVGESAFVSMYYSRGVSPDLLVHYRLYDNSFGYLSLDKSGETTKFKVMYSGILVKELGITPVWDSSRSLSFVLMDQSFQSVKTLEPNREYNFGIKYGSTMISHKVTKAGRTWTTRCGSAPRILGGYIDYIECWDLQMWHRKDGSVIEFSDYTESYIASKGELGVFTCTKTGQVNYALSLLDKMIYGTFQVK